MPKLTSQSEAWQRGYDWADGKGPYHELDCWDAAERWGYDFDTPEFADFSKGINFRQIEQAEEREFGE